MRPRIVAVVFLILLAVPTFAAVTGVVMTSDGQPVAGARVSLYASELPEARRARLLSATPEKVPLATTQTDAKGAFSLESPKETIVDLRVTARGYEPVSPRIERDENVGALVLMKAEMRSGTVKANGKPVANATVVLMYNAAEHVVKSDAEGRYEVPDPKRVRSIAVVHPDFAPSEESAMSMNGITNLHRTLTAGTALSGRVTSEDGKTPVAKATVTVDGWPLATSGDDGTFTIARAPAKWQQVGAQLGSMMGVRTTTSERPITIRMKKAASITGRVLDAKSKLPLAGVSLRSTTLGRMARVTDTAWGAITDAKGTFTLHALPGTLMVVAMHPAYEPRGIDVSAAAGQTVSKEFALAPMARVSGVVMDDERKPVPAAFIVPQEVREGMELSSRMMLASSSAASGPDGRFSMRVRSDIDLKLKATKKGLPPATSEAFKLGPAERKANVLLTVPSGVAVTGRVVDRSGQPLSGVSVVATAAVTGGRGMMMQRVMMGGPPPNEEETVRSGSDGTFTMRLTEGTYDFSFRRLGLATKHVRAKSVSLAGPNVVETTLDPSVEITGRVTRGGSGIEDVMIFSFSEGETTDAVTGPDGSFVLANLSPGPARLSLRKEDEMIGEQRSVTAPATDVVLELPAGVRVSGRVIDKSSRKPLPQFQVGVSQTRSGGGMMMMGPPLMRSFTSDDGTFTIDHVPAGAVTFMAQAPGYPASRVNLNVEENKPISDLVVELDTGVKLIGKITAPDGSPLADASVRLAMGGSSSSVSRGNMRRTVTSSTGEYELDALEPGEETIEINHAKYLPSRKIVQLKDRETRLDVRLSGGTRVSGTVVTESGAPVAEAEVDAMAMSGTMRRTKTDAAGRFEFDALSPARYNFTASKSGYAEGSVKDVDIAAGTPIRIALRSGGVIYGFVRGLTEQEMSAAMVEARGPDGYATGAVDSTGAYRIEGAPTGTVRVSAVVQQRNFMGRKTSPAQTVEIAARGSQQVDIEFRSDTVVKGHVRRNGAPVGNAMVTFAPKPGGPQTSSFGTTDQTGAYTVSGLDDGEYSVIVTDTSRFSSYTTTYEVRGSATFDIEHTAQGLRGRVIDAASGDPVANARVQLRLAGQQSGIRDQRVAATDVNGVFQLELVPPGTYTVTADGEGYGNQITDITIGDRAVDNFEIKLSRNAGATLKIVDARDGRTLSGMIIVFDMQGQMVHEHRGSFFGDDEAREIKLPLAPGRYIATVWSQGYGARHIALQSPGALTVQLRPGSTLLVRSKHSERVRVRLVDADGIPYPRFGARLPFQMLNPTPGTTTMENIAAGNYLLQRLGENDVVLESKPVTVVEGQPASVDI